MTSVMIFVGILLTIAVIVGIVSLIKYIICYYLSMKQRDKNL